MNCMWLRLPIVPSCGTPIAIWDQSVYYGHKDKNINLNRCKLCSIMDGVSFIDNFIVLPVGKHTIQVSFHKNNPGFLELNKTSGTIFDGSKRCSQHSFLSFLDPKWNQDTCHWWQQGDRFIRALARPWDSLVILLPTHNNRYNQHGSNHYISW